GEIQFTDIQCDMNLPYTSIQTTIATYQSSTTGTSSSRIGRPEILSDADKRYILLQIKRDPFIKTEDICKSLGMPISTHTIARMLKRIWVCHWRAQKMPLTYLLSNYLVRILMFGCFMWKRNDLVTIYILLVAENYVYFVEELYNNCTYMI